MTNIEGEDWGSGIIRNNGKNSSIKTEIASAG